MVLRLLALLASLSLSPPVHAERLESPLELIYLSTNNLIAGKLIEINPAGRLVFERGEVLSGENPIPERIDLRAPVDALSLVILGHNYVFACTTYISSPTQPGTLSRGPDGPRLVVSNGLNPALFEDTPRIRAILRLGASEPSRKSRRTLQVLLDMLGDPDPKLLDLASAEIALNDELRLRIRPTDRVRIEALVRNETAPPMARSALLELAAREPTRFGQRWWLDAAQSLIAKAPLDGYTAASDGRAGLVRAALGVVDRASFKLPPPVLIRWIHSDSSAIAEAALLVLRQQAPGQERPALEQALVDPSLPAEMRAFLADHLRRLDLLDARLQALKGGSQ